MTQRLSHRTLSERLALLPQDQHVTVKQYESRYGMYYRAFWHYQPGSKETRRTKSLYLGLDTDGTIAAYIAQQKRYRKFPLEGQVLIRDEQGKPLYIDEVMTHFFKPPLPYKKIYVNEEGKRYLVDYGAADDPSDLHVKQVPLERYIYEVLREVAIPYTWEVVQRIQGNDFTIENLVLVRKVKKGEAA